MHTTKDIVSKFAELPEDQRQAIVADALQATAGMKWLPLPLHRRRGANLSPAVVDLCCHATCLPVARLLPATGAALFEVT